VRRGPARAGPRAEAGAAATLGRAPDQSGSAARLRSGFALGWLCVGCASAATGAPPRTPPANVSAAAQRPAMNAPSGAEGNPRPVALEHGGSPSRATSAVPEDPAAPLRAELARGNAALAEDRLEAASTHYENARRLAPSDPAAPIGLLRVRWAALGLPTAYAEAPRHPELERLVLLADDVLAAHGSYAPAWLEKGRLLLVLGDAPGALASLRRAVEMEGSDPEAHSALGIAYLASGESQKALDELEVASRLAPNEPERLTNLGTAYMLRGRVSEAIASYERALALQPDDARTHGDLGAAYLSDDRADRALPHLLRATSLAPRRATFLTNLGYAYQRQGQLAKAVETQRQALAIDPKLGSAWINLGNTLAELGQYEQAAAALHQAEALDPSDPRPKSSLQDLAELRAREAARPPRRSGDDSPK
jgi:Flp pilus assembly protein TadD